MNKPIAIILLVVLALILILALRALVPMFTNFFKKLPLGIFLIFIAAILGVMAYLVYFLATEDRHGGAAGDPGAEIPQITDAPQQQEDPGEPADISANLQHCIVLREDRIWIEGKEADLEQAGKYIDEHVESNTELVVVDDYSLASLHHQITNLCDKKGVNYRIENEEWIKE